MRCLSRRPRMSLPHSFLCRDTSPAQSSARPAGQGLSRSQWYAPPGPHAAPTPVPATSAVIHRQHTTIRSVTVDLGRGRGSIPYAKRCCLEMFGIHLSQVHPDLGADCCGAGVALCGAAAGPLSTSEASNRCLLFLQFSFISAPCWKKPCAGRWKRVVRLDR
jgi:hypothetical protein